MELGRLLRVDAGPDGSWLGLETHFIRVRLYEGTSEPSIA